MPAILVPDELQYNFRKNVWRKKVSVFHPVKASLNEYRSNTIYNEGRADSSCSDGLKTGSVV